VASTTIFGGLSHSTVRQRRGLTFHGDAPTQLFSLATSDGPDNETRWGLSLVVVRTEWVVDLTDRSASMLQGVQAGIGLLHHVLAVKLASHGSDGSLPLRPWWTP
jgi:hypothetical protein